LLLSGKTVRDAAFRGRSLKGVDYELTDGYTGSSLLVTFGLVRTHHLQESFFVRRATHKQSQVIKMFQKMTMTNAMLRKEPKALSGCGVFAQPSPT